jgi:preprotein translocase subunit SecA
MAAPIEVEVKAVEIRAELRQIKTMADHTANVTLNVPEYCREQVKVLLDWLGLNVGVVIVGVPPEQKREDEYGL